MYIHTHKYMYMCVTATDLFSHKKGQNKHYKTNFKFLLTDFRNSHTDAHFGCGTLHKALQQRQHSAVMPFWFCSVRVAI